MVPRRPHNTKGVSALTIALEDIFLGAFSFVLMLYAASWLRFADATLHEHRDGSPIARLRVGSRTPVKDHLDVLAMDLGEGSRNERQLRFVDQVGKLRTEALTIGAITLAALAVLLIGAADTSATARLAAQYFIVGIVCTFGGPAVVTSGSTWMRFTALRDVISIGQVAIILGVAALASLAYSGAGNVVAVLILFAVLVLEVGRFQRRVALSDRVFPVGAPLPAVTEFVDDDTGYLSWLEMNPAGFVVNTTNPYSRKYLVIHRARCHTISGQRSRSSAWTVDYAKVCAAERSQLQQWALDKAGGRPKSCGVCLKQ